MDYDQIKLRLAPCGLHCGKCFAFSKGEIVTQSKQLIGALGNFEPYAQRFVTLLGEPVFDKYPDFKEMLNYFASAKCTGCRTEKCKLFQDCNVRECHAAKSVDFCFQCNEFPCTQTGFDEHLLARSVKSNFRMKEIGVDAYYNEIKDNPRYL